nr:hypothetical protein [Halorussus sp. DT72]
MGRIPGASRAAFGLGSLLANHWRSRFRAGLEASATPPDARLFEGSVGDVLAADAAEAFRRGSRGPAREFPLLGEPWGFDASEVETPVSLWHGERDGRVESGVAERFAERLPAADLTLADEAHYSTLVRNREAILRSAVV